jgi:hypothetical protein
VDDVRLVPADGGPPLIARFLALTQLADAEREIARGLVEARLDAYRVVSAPAGATIELVSLTDGAHVHLFADDGFQLLDVGDMLVARIVHNPSIATAWGLGARLTASTGGAGAPAPPPSRATARRLLDFHPDDAAEPLPDGRDLQSVTWRIDDDDAILEALEDDDELECLGEHIPDGWAFAWLDDADCGHLDLGGWVDGEEIEVARLIVSERELTVVSAGRDALGSLIAHIQRATGELIAGPPLRRAA